MSAQGREVLTIMITAYATFETAVKATKLGAYDFLAKPFTPEELRYALRKATSQLILSKQARKLAEEKREIRFNFISVLAHELKAPLNAVEGYLNILRTTEADQNLQMVERSIVRVDGMKKLIMDLLDLTRIESGQRERVVKRLDLRELAKASMELFAVDAERRGIAVELEDGDDIELLADPGEVEIVFNNLISNAVKYNRDGGDGQRQAQPQGRRRHASPSRDTGIGLTPEEAGKLFNEFTRIKNEQTVKILGSGLGLSTVRKIANMYDGEAEGHERARRRQHVHGHAARRAAGRLAPRRTRAATPRPTAPQLRRALAAPDARAGPPGPRRPAHPRFLTLCEDVRY